MSSRNTIKLLIAISAGWVIVCAAIMGFFFYTEMHKPQWQKDSEQAADLTESDPERAIELYQKAISEAKNDNVSIESRLDLMESTAGLLYSQSKNLEARKMYHEASLIARRSGLTERQSDFLVSEARAWHAAWKSGEGEIPDEAMVRTALLMRAKDEPLNETVQMAHCTMGDIAYDHEQFDKARAFFKKALEEAKTIKFVNGKREARLGLISVAFAEEKYIEGNDGFLEGIDDKDCDAQGFRTDFMNIANETDFFDSEEEKVQAAIQASFEQHEFADLDEFFDIDLKLSDEWPTGLTFADNHINCLTDIFDDKKAQDASIATATLWNENHPKSQAAKLVLADLLINRAGSEVKELENTDSGTDTPEVTELFVRAKRVLESEKVKTPSWYRCYQRIAKRFHYDAANFNKITDEGRKKYPSYKRLVFIKAATMLPGQQGNDGDLEKYLDEECGKLSSDEGDKMYAQAVMYFEKYDTTDVLSNTKLSWDRTRHGMQLLVAQNKDWLYGRAFLSAMATVKGDFKTAERAF